MSDFLCLGEILVDWVCTSVGFELAEAQSFTKAPGGAPANVAVGLARQGAKAAFIGRVSTDEFGKWLKNILEEEGIDTNGTVVDSEAQTRMAYVVTLQNGDRKLAEFSKISVADSRLSPDDLKEAQFAEAKALHFGSISLIADPAAAATKTAIELASQHNLLISYDPNVRIGLWPSPDVCKHTILSTLKFAHLVKINLDELEFLTGSREFQAAENLRKEHNLPLLIITLDSQGAYFATDKGSKTVGGFEIKFMEATGAGDGFVSGILKGLVEEVGTATDKRNALK
ncbi:MAG: carbohydrate kinase, partial [Candidatus Obscuribacterales bacterium]|nr:carbohydrate kinase [Candidatus Obscuribacterales bacterium]